MNKQLLLIYFALLSGVVAAWQKAGPIEEASGSSGCEFVEEFVNTAVFIKSPTTLTADKVYLFEGYLTNLNTFRCNKTRHSCVI